MRTQVALLVALLTPCAQALAVQAWRSDDWLTVEFVNVTGDEMVRDATSGLKPSNGPDRTVSRFSPRGEFLRQQDRDELMVRDLLGKSVMNPHGVELGEVHDVILAEHGSVIGTVISVGGFLGLGDKLVGLPWNGMTIHSVGNAVIVNLEKDDLARAPEYRTQEEARMDEEAEITRRDSTRLQNNYGPPPSSTKNAVGMIR